MKLWTRAWMRPWMRPWTRPCMRPWTRPWIKSWMRPWMKHGGDKAGLCRDRRSDISLAEDKTLRHLVCIAPPSVWPFTLASGPKRCTL